MARCAILTIEKERSYFNGSDTAATYLSPRGLEKGENTMKIQFSTKNMTIPDRVYSHAEQRINELDQLFLGTPEASVVFSAEKGKSVIELTIYTGSTIFRVVEKTSDMIVSIDAAVSSVRRQMRTNRARLAKNVNVDAFEKDSDEVIFIPEVDRYDEPSYQVVRSKYFEFGPMTVQEAILQMNLIGHAFFAFRNEERDDAFSVVYRRNDGGYGILVDKA